MLFGDNGIITKAQEASFRQEMAEIKENVDLKKNELQLLNQNVSEVFEKIKYSEATEWEDTLKREIVYWGGHETGISEITKEYAKTHFEELISKSEDGYLNDVYYIDTNTADGKERTYIYDAIADIVFKIKPTTIWVYTVHSVNELDNAKGGSDKPTYETINDDCQFVQVGNISYYEPNLSNFTLENTELIFYNPNNDDQYISVTPKEYLSNSKMRTKEESGTTYEFHNYNEGNKVWANIKTKNTANNTESWWVWVPRYAYKIDGTTTSIIYITTDNKQADGSDLPEGYVVHTAFETQGAEKGIWVSKYEPMQTATTEVDEYPFYVPDLTGFNKETTYIEVYDSTTDDFIETKLSNISNITDFTRNNNWFDYKNKIWANIKTINTENNTESWWVWIPRYAYSITETTTDIIFIDTNNNPLDGSDLPSNYVVHTAFETQGAEKGIWISKYEPMQTANDSGMTNHVNPPDLRNYNVDTTYIECYNEQTQEFTEQTLRSILSNKSVINSNNVVTTVDIDYSKIKGTWYDYSKRLWANIKTKNTENNTESWWVWIPRYAYNIYDQTTTDIIYLDVNGNPTDGSTLPVTYIPHPAFETEGAHEGIWASKYEPMETN